MSTIAYFVGVDRYRDPQITDLAGAVRDATALWALFADTLVDIDGRLLVDEQATADALRSALLDPLLTAGEDNTVILSFAGHGTRSHALVAHDTAVSELEATTVSMAELAQAFRQSKAGSILCILDCCFSGAAPARVLEQTPIPRDLPFDPRAFAGKGRVLITASGVSEPAYEDPAQRHGLLTQALIDVLSGGDGDISLLTAMDVVMERVRAAAACLGCRQTPVAFNLVEGGLTMPALQPGKRYYAAFPGRRRTQVEGKLTDLVACGIPGSIVDAWAESFSNLNGLQLSAINDYGVLDGESLTVIAPTSAGKTFIGEMAAIKTVTEGHRAIFLFPYRALVNDSTYAVGLRALTLE